MVDIRSARGGETCRYRYIVNYYNQNMHKSLSW